MIIQYKIFQIQFFYTFILILSVFLIYHITRRYCEVSSYQMQTFLVMTVVMRLGLSYYMYICIQIRISGCIRNNMKFVRNINMKLIIKIR